MFDIKTKVKTFNGVVHAILGGDKIQKKCVHYFCIAEINIDSVMKMDKKSYSQVCLEECRHEVKNKKMTRFV